MLLVLGQTLGKENCCLFVVVKRPELFKVKFYSRLEIADFERVVFEVEWQHFHDHFARHFVQKVKLVVHLICDLEDLNKFGKHLELDYLVQIEENLVQDLTEEGFSDDVLKVMALRDKFQAQVDRVGLVILNFRIDFKDVILVFELREPIALPDLGEQQEEFYELALVRWQSFFCYEDMPDVVHALQIQSFCLCWLRHYSFQKPEEQLGAELVEVFLKLGVDSEAQLLAEVSFERFEFSSLDQQIRRDLALFFDHLRQFFIENILKVLGPNKGRILVFGAVREQLISGC